MRKARAKTRKKKAYLVSTLQFVSNYHSNAQCAYYSSKRIFPKAFGTPGNCPYICKVYVNAKNGNNV